MLAALVGATMLAAPPIPTARQLEWHKREVYAFVHFGPNTFTGKEWGDGKEDPRRFNPTDLDCDQWVNTFKAAGMEGVIITAKHHDGFCLWPSKFSGHTVAQSPWRNGKGDLLRELSVACRRAGLKFGVYLSPWDRNHPDYGTDRYNDQYVGALTEVLSNYGPVFEVWFDGANGEGPNGKRQAYDWPRYHAVVRKLQPKAVMFSDAGPDIRWVGNESGIAPETSWGMVPSGRYVPGTPHFKELGEGSRTGDLYIPSECDVSIRPGWFYRSEEDSKVKTGDQLFDLYMRSVGRNSNFLLNVPPDTRGRIHENDIRALMDFKARRDAAFGLPQVMRLSAKPGRVVATGKAKTGLTYLKLEEDIRKGQKISKFKVTDQDSGATIATGTTIGNRRIMSVSGNMKSVVIEFEPADARLKKVTAYARR